MIKTEINELMEKMDNASKHIFDTYDYTNKEEQNNSRESKNIKIENLSHFSQIEPIKQPTKTIIDTKLDNKENDPAAGNWEYYILKYKYEASLNTIKEKEQEINSWNDKIIQLKQDIEESKKLRELEECEWKLEKSKLTQKIKMLENTSEMNKILPAYNDEISYLHKKVLLLNKELRNNQIIFTKDDNEDPLIQEEKQIRTLKKRVTMLSKEKTASWCKKFMTKKKK
jgi:hypothetical protein